MADSVRGVDHADSMDSHESTSKQSDKKTKNRRPANTAFRQQRLKAWQPILTPKTVLPLFFTIGIIFAPIGGLLLYASAQVQEIRIDYTHCSTQAPDFSTSSGNFSSMPSDTIKSYFKASTKPINAKWAIERGLQIKTKDGVPVDTNRCHLQFNIPEDMSAPVLFYYQLTNFHQNHRRYATSMDLEQLKGKPRSYNDIHSSDCTPLYGEKDQNKPYYPCGLIANSMFNDTFTSPMLLNPQNAENDEPREYTMENNTNIAWGSDKSLYGTTEYAFDQILPPPNWHKRYPDGYSNSTPPPNLHDWEGFQVWMRTAGLPTFSKLYQRNDKDAMVHGSYEVQVDDHFPTTEYRGTKSIVITTRTVMGGRNPFLGIAYVVVGGVCILLGAVFTATHLFKPRKLGDHTYLSWNNTPASKTTGAATATASGRDIRPGEA